MIVNVSSYTESYFPFISELDYFHNVDLSNRIEQLPVIRARESLEKDFASVEIGLEGEFFKSNIYGTNQGYNLYVAEDVRFKNNLLKLENRLVIQRSWTFDVMAYLTFDSINENTVLLKEIFWRGEHDPEFYVKMIIALIHNHHYQKTTAFPMPQVKYDSLKQILHTALTIYGTAAHYVEIDDDFINSSILTEIEKLNSGEIQIPYPNLGFVGYQIIDDELFYVNQNGVKSSAREFNESGTLNI